MQPYAPPKAPYEPPPPPGPGPGGPPLSIEPTDVLSGAWNVFTRQWTPLCVGILIMGAILAVPILVVYIGGMAMAVAATETASRGGDPDAGIAIALGFVGVVGAVMMLVFLLSPIFTARYLRMVMTAVRGGTPAIGDLFKGEMRYGSMLALVVLHALVVGLGYMLLIVPGVILAIGLQFSAFFVVDRGMGAVEAMKASWELTKGRKGQVFVVVLLMGLVAAGAGMIPFVGHFIGYSIMFLGLAIAYMRLTGEAAPVLPAPAIPYPPYGPPPPYGAPPPPYGAPPYGGAPPQGPYGGGYGGR